MREPDRSFWAQLLQRPVRELTPLSGGRNSRVWRLTDCQGQDFVAKEYFRTLIDSRDRLGTEWKSLHFLHQHGMYCVPRPVACHVPCSCAIYTFVAGQSPAPYGTAEDVLRPVADFVRRLYDIRAAAQVARLPRASEACFTLQEITEQLHRRFKSLRDMEATLPVQRDCLAFLHQRLVPHLEYCISAARTQIVRLGLEANSLLPPHVQMPSPSDLGFHNAILQPDGALCFVDFEYFGMDDPVKLLADVCIHPAMNFTTVQKKFFLEHILQHVEAHDTRVRARLKAYAPLWRLKWCVIVLNEFVSRERMRRDFAGGPLFVQEQILYQQLVKAKTMLEEENHDLLCAISV